MQKMNGTDRTVIRVGNCQFIGLTLALITIAQNAEIKDGELVHFTLVVPRTKHILAPYRIKFILRTIFSSVGKEAGFEYFIFVPIIGLSLEIQKLVTDYLTDKTVVSRIQPYHDATSVFRF